MSSTLPLHATTGTFEIRDNCLCVGGDKLTEIAANAGQTPFYAYDARLITDKIRSLRELLPAEVSLHYAIKANPMPDVVQLVSKEVNGLDVASGGELTTALQTDCAPSDISFAGPGKTPHELRAAVAAGITLNVESRTELSRLVTIAGETGKTPNVAIRVNPDFELKSSGMKMAGGPKPFGIDAEQVPQLLSEIEDLPVEFEGFHIFSGSQNLRADAICESQNKAYDLAITLMKSFDGRSPRFLNIGGGFGVPYFPGDQTLDLEPIAANLERLVQRCRKDLPNTELVLELGRYLVAEAGLYVCRVLDKKVSRGRTFLVTDGGLHHHLAASGNFGQIIRKNYPVLVGNRVRSDDVEKVSVVGPLCTPLDLLADQMDMARADIGDLIAVFQSGAYGFSASPHHFLGHPPPLELLL